MSSNAQNGDPSEVRYGDFFQIVKDEEIAAATLIFLQATRGCNLLQLWL